MLNDSFEVEILLVSKIILNQLKLYILSTTLIFNDQNNESKST
jgi:hypothetical protein